LSKYRREGREVKIGVILNSKDPETAWNALRLGNEALRKGHEVKVFLLGGGVEIENIRDGDFDVANVLGEFISNRGELLACGSCLKLRQQKSAVCPVSTMSQLVEMIADSDKLVTFG